MNNNRFDELSKLTMTALRPIAKDLGIKGYYNLKKADIIQKIFEEENKNVPNIKLKADLDNDNEDDEDDDENKVDEGEALIEIKKKLDDLNKLFTTLILKRA